MKHIDHNAPIALRMFCRNKIRTPQEIKEFIMHKTRNLDTLITGSAQHIADGGKFKAKLQDLVKQYQAYL